MTQLAVKKDNPADAPGGVARLNQYFWQIAMALLVVRILVDGACNLVPDEAFYWTWTRHLNLGYLDHPPMVAWVIWLSTRVFGNTEVGVRLPASVLSIASLAVLIWIARQILHDARAVGFVVLMWIAGPLLPVIGTIITPDAPATFFSVCALALAVKLVSRDDAAGQSAGQKWTTDARLWIAFGVMCGLAFLSKYTTVLVPAAVVLALIFSRRGYRQLVRPWVYLSAVVSLLVFSPCIWWNYRHHWASFAFQLHHGSSGGLTEGIADPFAKLVARASSFGQFVGGQAAVWTPVLFGMGIFVIVANWRKYGKIGNVDRLLLWSATLPLVFFAFMSFLSHSEINWPAFAYFPLSLLMARFLSENWKGYRVQWMWLGCEVAIGFTLAVHLVAATPVQEFLFKHGVHVTHQVTDLHGWNQFGRRLTMRTIGLPIVCNRHQDAGEAAFYMQGQPDIWCDGVGSRITAFDFFDKGQPDYAHIPDLAFVGGHVDLFNRKWGYHTVEISPVTLLGLGKNKGHVVTVVSHSR